jgi:hypothetical protein
MTVIYAILLVQTLTLCGLGFICWALNRKIDHMWEQFEWYRGHQQERIRALEGRP